MDRSGRYPPAPWRLRGEAAIVAARVREASAERLRSPGRVLLTARGWTLGGVLLARYDTRATLPYHELIVFSGVACAGARVAFVVSHIYVDSLASLHGGREIWGLPKELADFKWDARDVTVTQDGRTLLRASLRRRAGRLLLPLHAPVFGELAGASLFAAGRGFLKGMPALAELDVAPRAPSPSSG